MYTRSRVFGWSLLLATAGSLAAQTAAPPASPQNAPPAAKVEGVVINALSREPVRKATVTLMPMGRPQQTTFGPEGPPGTLNASTDQEGKFVFTGVEAGRYALSAQKGGFVRSSYGSRARPLGRSSGEFRMGSLVELTAGQQFTGARIELVPQGIIAGRVLDDEGEPAQGLPIQVLRYRYMQNRRQLVPIMSVQSDDRGEFRIANLPPGEVILQVMPARWGEAPAATADAKGAVKMAYVSTYYPGVTEVSQASKITVTAGGELTGHDIRVQKSRVTTVRGTVIEPSGQPAKTFMVSLTPKDSVFPGAVRPQMSNKGDGSFLLSNIPPGAYTLMVQTGEGRSPRFSQQTVNVGNDGIDDLQIRLNEPVTIKGQVNVREGQIDVTNVRVQAMPASGRWGISQQKPTETGTFAWENVSPGTYRVAVFITGQEGGYAESVRYGDQEVLGKEFEITGTAAPLTVTVATGASNISGTVTEKGAPAMGTTVLILSADAARRDMSTTRQTPADQNGSFTIKNLPPGEYVAFAFDEIEYGAWEDPELFKKIETKAVRFTAQKNGSSTLTLTPTTIPD